MAIVTMAFNFTEGPRSTQLTRDQIEEAVHTVASERRFANFTRRALYKPRPNRLFGAFTPTDEDEHVVLDDTRKADWRIGWRYEYKEFVPQVGLRELGWRVVFEVYDTGVARHVVASVRGASERHEVKRFVRHVFTALS